MTEESKKRIAKVRELLAFIEEHDLETRGYGLSAVLTMTCESKEDLIAQTRGMGKLTKKVFNDIELFVLRKEFDYGIHIDFDLARDKICERIVTKKIVPAKPETLLSATEEKEEEVVTWKCPDSLLAKVADDAPAEIDQQERDFPMSPEQERTLKEILIPAWDDEAAKDFDVRR